MASEAADLFELEKRGFTRQPQRFLMQAAATTSIPAATSQLVNNNFVVSIKQNQALRVVSASYAISDAANSGKLTVEGSPLGFIAGAAANIRVTRSVGSQMGTFSSINQLCIQPLTDEIPGVVLFGSDAAEFGANGAFTIGHTSAVTNTDGAVAHSVGSSVQALIEIYTTDSVSTK